MAWARLHGNWKQLKVLIRDRWRGRAQIGSAQPERREELVERLQQLARDEIRNQGSESPRRDD